MLQVVHNRVPPPMRGSLVQEVEHVNLYSYRVCRADLRPLPQHAWLLQHVHQRPSGLVRASFSDATSCGLDVPLSAAADDVLLRLANEKHEYSELSLVSDVLILQAGGAGRLGTEAGGSQHVRHLGGHRRSADAV